MKKRQRRFLIMAATLTMLLCATLRAQAAEVNVLDYGANASDAKSDFYAIQSALDTARSATDSLTTVIVPKGTYYIDNCLTIYSNTHLKLDANTTIVRMNENNRMLTNPYSGGASGAYNRSKNITISGGTWNGNVKKQLCPISLISIEHASSVTLKNTKLTDSCGGHMVIFDACADVTVDHVEFHGLKPYLGNDNTYYVYLYGNAKTADERKVAVLTQEALHFDYASETQTMDGTHVPADTHPCRNVTVTGCTFTNVNSGIGTHHIYKNQYSEHITVRNNTFTNLKGSCLQAYHFNNVEFSGNTAKNCGSLAMLNACSNVTLASNSITAKTPLTGADYPKNPEFHVIHVKAQSKGITVKNNILSGGTGSGIFCDNVTITATSNTITSSKKEGIRVKNNSSATLKKNTITSSALAGISVEKSGANVQNNTVTKAGGAGIAASNSGKLNPCSGNTIVSPKTNGIFVTASTLNASNNTIQSTGAAGIRGTSGAVITANNNTIKNTTDHSLSVTGAHLTASGNTITSSKTSGIYAKDKGTVNAQKNKIRSCVGNGIYADSSCTLTLLTNDISGSKKNGIYANNGCSLTITSNTIIDSSNTGICLQGKCKANIQKNTVTGSKNKDMSLSGVVSTTVKNNYVGVKGIAVASGSGASVSGNKTSITLASVSLSKTSYTYSGSAKKPTVTVKYQGKTLKNGTHYTVSYANNTKVGVASVTVTGKGTYGGSVKKTFVIKSK